MQSQSSSCSLCQNLVFTPEMNGTAAWEVGQAEMFSTFLFFLEASYTVKYG